MVIRSYKDYSILPVNTTIEDLIKIDGGEGIRPKTNGTEGGRGRRGPCQSATFPAKLYEILSKTELSDIITWMSHGRSWKIIDQVRFSNEVIPQFFAQSKQASFMRQVNGWGFIRITQGCDQNSYYNELFLRTKVHLVKFIQRRSAPKKSGLECEPNFQDFLPLPPNPTEMTIVSSPLLPPRLPPELPPSATNATFMTSKHDTEMPEHPIGPMVFSGADQPLEIQPRYPVVIEKASAYCEVAMDTYSYPLSCSSVSNIGSIHSYPTPDSSFILPSNSAYHQSFLSPGPTPIGLHGKLDTDVDPKNQMSSTLYSTPISTVIPSKNGFAHNFSLENSSNSTWMSSALASKHDNYSTVHAVPLQHLPNTRIPSGFGERQQVLPSTQMAGTYGYTKAISNEGTKAHWNQGPGQPHRMQHENISFEKNTMVPEVTTSSTSEAFSRKDNTNQKFNDSAGYKHTTSSYFMAIGTKEGCCTALGSGIEESASVQSFSDFEMENCSQDDRSLSSVEIDVANFSSESMERLPAALDDIW